MLSTLNQPRNDLPEFTFDLALSILRSIGRARHATMKTFNPAASASTASESGQFTFCSGTCDNSQGSLFPAQRVFAVC